MKKFYKIIFLIIVLIILTTFNNKKLATPSKKNNYFFAVKNIEVINNILIDEKKIKEKLGYIYNKNIFFLKKVNIYESLKDINFIDKIKVKKIYPNTIVVEIYETKLEAILFKNKNKYLIDSSSNLISFSEDLNVNRLPSIFGENVEVNFIPFLKKLKKNNFPYRKINNYYYFKIGRWDLQFLDNKIIKLPYNNIDEAIIKSIELLKRKDFNNYNTIDLRIDGKIIVE